MQTTHGQEKGPCEAADERVHGLCPGGEEADLKVQLESAKLGDKQKIGGALEVNRENQKKLLIDLNFVLRRDI